jgi:hypothetical protein
MKSHSRGHAIRRLNRETQRYERQSNSYLRLRDSQIHSPRDSNASIEAPGWNGSVESVGPQRKISTLSHNHLDVYAQELCVNQLDTVVIQE